MLNIELATGFTFPAEECGVIPHIVARCDTLANSLDVVEQIAEDGALDTVKVYNAEDVLLMEFSEVVCDGFQGILGEEDVTLHLYLTEGAERIDSGSASENAEALNILFGMNDEEEEEEE